MSQSGPTTGWPGDEVRRRLFDLQGHVVVVTGAASGLGLAFAEVTAANGATVVLADVNEDQLRVAVAGLEGQGLSAYARATDVADPADVEALFAEVARDHGRVDAAFANAGISDGKGIRNPAGGIDQLPVEDWARVLSVDLHGVFWTVRFAAAAMKPRRSGSIVITSSIAGLRPSPNVGYGYSVAKAAVAHLTRQAALELGPWGIRVNSIAPGPTRTNIGGRRPAPEAEAAWTATIPIGRMGDPDDFKGLALLLASGASSFMSGAVIPLDGGAMTLSIGTTEVLYHPEPRVDGALEH